MAMNTASQMASVHSASSASPAGVDLRRLASRREIEREARLHQRWLSSVCLISMSSIEQRGYKRRPRNKAEALAGPFKFRRKIARNGHEAVKSRFRKIFCFGPDALREYVRSIGAGPNAARMKTVR